MNLSSTPSKPRPATGTDSLSQLPVGSAALWLSVRRDDDVRERALTVLREQPRLNSSVLRQFARDLAFAYARAARRNQPALTAAFAERHRSSDLGHVVYQVGDRLVKILGNDRQRLSLTEANLTASAERLLTRLAADELARGPARH